MEPWGYTNIIYILFVLLLVLFLTPQVLGNQIIDPVNGTMGLHYYYLYTFCITFSPIFTHIVMTCRSWLSIFGVVIIGAFII